MPHPNMLRSGTAPNPSSITELMCGLGVNARHWVMPIELSCDCLRERQAYFCQEMGGLQLKRGGGGVRPGSQEGVWGGARGNIGGGGGGSYFDTRDKGLQYLFPVVHSRLLVEQRQQRVSAHLLPPLAHPAQEVGALPREGGAHGDHGDVVVPLGGGALALVQYLQ